MYGSISVSYCEYIRRARLSYLTDFFSSKSVSIVHLNPCLKCMPIGQRSGVFGGSACFGSAVYRLGTRQVGFLKIHKLGLVWQKKHTKNQAWYTLLSLLGSTFKNWDPWYDRKLIRLSLLFIPCFYTCLSAMYSNFLIDVGQPGGAGQFPPITASIDAVQLVSSGHEAIHYSGSKSGVDCSRR